MPRSTSLLNKLAYFQGGGGVNEPTPGKKKYNSDPAIVVQPRFKEPFYRNYDLYSIPGMEDIGPGTGWHGLQNYDSVKEFLDARKDRLKPRYVSDDSWILDSGKRTKENPNIKARAAIFDKIKRAGPNYDLGKGLYSEMSDGKVDSVDEFREEGGHGPAAFFADDNDLGTGLYENLEHYKSVRDFIEHTPLGRDHGAKIPPEWERAKHPVQKKDVNHIDFPIDDMVNRQNQMIYPEEAEYQIRKEKGDTYDYPSEGDNMDPSELNISMTTPQIAGEHSYLPDPDFEGKSDNGSQLDFGRDYTEETLPGRGSDIANDDDKLDELESKYLEPTEIGLFGLPDGVDPEGHDSDQTIQIEQPYDTTSDISGQMYDDKWNI